MPNGKYTDGKYDYSGEDLWQSDYTLGLNVDYKFVLSSGIYFTTGANIGGTMKDDIRTHSFMFDFFARPNVSMGYMF